MKFAWVPLAAAAVLFVGCEKNIENREAVQVAVAKYVNTKGINSDQMDVRVNSVKFQGTNAEANVSFVPKSTPGSTGVTATYQLERIHDQWEVKSRSAIETLHMNGQPSELPGTGGPGRQPGALADSPDGHVMPQGPGHPPIDSQYGHVTGGSNAGNKGATGKQR